MRKFILTAFMVATAALSVAQTPKADFKKNIRLSASNFMAYPGPTQPRLTPAPAGKRPCYISHYGRHGSRYPIDARDLDYPYETLLMASQQGVLTELGQDVMQRIELMRAEADGRLGDLSPLGATQHRAIARRMAERFPEVFEGDVHVDARSTPVVRCILSMENALQELVALNPGLRVSHDASQHDMYYMNQTDKQLVAQRGTKPTRDAFEAYCQKYTQWRRVVGSLFTDTAYVNREVNGERLNYYLFKLASLLQNMELRKRLTLYDLFTDEEVLDNWRKDNAWWYLSLGPTPLNGATQPYLQRNLLRRIIEEADSCLRQDRPGASLRYGHDTMVLPLVCLMGLDGYDQQLSDLAQLERKGWLNYRVFPMACNVQLVFYRSSPDDEDVLVKVLLNENETRLPLKSKTAPYYRWADVRDYYLKKLDDYEAGLAPTEEQL